MIGSYPVSELAPLDYRYALDAAMTRLAGSSATLILCQVPQLSAEVRQRLPEKGLAEPASSALWVEPLCNGWRGDLGFLMTSLPIGAPLVVLASCPLARLLPERRGWPGQPLCLRVGGAQRLQQEMRQAGFVIEARYGFHTLISIGLNSMSRQLERFGRPDLGDRLHFTARLHYVVTAPWDTFSMVALLVGRKGSSYGDDGRHRKSDQHCGG